MKLLKCCSLKIIIVLFFFFISNSLYSQDHENKIKKTTILSVACPGLGQIYNKKYWKVPVIYASLSTSIYYYIRNNNKYQQYQSAYIAATDDDDNTINNSGYNASNLITLQNHHRDSRDLSGFLFFLIYVLNIIDASVDAHLMNYNLNDDLSLYLKHNQMEHVETVSLCLKLNL